MHAILSFCVLKWLSISFAHNPTRKTKMRLGLFGPVDTVRPDQMRAPTSSSFDVSFAAKKQD